jgi:hypothetical protein
MFLVFFFFSLSAVAAKPLNDLSIEDIAQGACGTLASAMTERVYNTNREMKKEYYKTPVFDKDTDFEMMKDLRKLTSESETFTSATPDSRRMASLIAAFRELKRRNYSYTRICLGVYRPGARKCFSRYRSNNKADLDVCMREVVDKADEAALVKEFFLKEIK